MNKKEKINKIINEYENRVDLLYTLYHNGSYFDEIKAIQKDLEKKYNCKIDIFPWIYKINKIELL